MEKQKIYTILNLKCQECTAKIHCEECGSSVHSDLSARGGISDIQVDMTNKRLSFAADEKREEEILDFLEGIGIFADEMEEESL
jgi:hypothetical protein